MMLRARPGVAGIGIGGREFVPDADGFLDLPDDFVAAALDAGFELARPVVTEAAVEAAEAE